jgi:phenylalanyl-tRNA synthetase beta chain
LRLTTRSSTRASPWADPQCQIKPSPYWVQRRLRAAGMRPISNIVDATNYTMLEIGEPLHAFDYDVLVEARRWQAGRDLHPHRQPRRKADHPGWRRAHADPTNVLVCDRPGPLSLAGVMGGAESEVSDKTTNILLEAAAWNFINIRKTANQHNLPSEAPSASRAACTPAWPAKA